MNKIDLGLVLPLIGFSAPCFRDDEGVSGRPDQRGATDIGGCEYGADFDGGGWLWRFRVIWLTTI